MDTSFLNRQELQVLEFAKKWHGDQKRKYTSKPYWHHLVNVAKLAHSHDLDRIAICAAILHDIVEDTSMTTKNLLGELDLLGFNVGECFAISYFVSQLTSKYSSKEFPNIKRSKRKQLEAERLIQISATAQSIKYCDIIDNCKNIKELDPVFAKKYLAEKRQVLKGMNRGDKELYKLACDTVGLNF